MQNSTKNLVGAPSHSLYSTQLVFRIMYLLTLCDKKVPNLHV